jgi:phosphate transport system substrate-binding protein
VTGRRELVFDAQRISAEFGARDDAFFRWSLESGQSQAELLNYVPLPPALIEQIEVYWQQNFEALTASASPPAKH